MAAEQQNRSNHNLPASGGKKAHFIGIAGVGMAATAKLLSDQGWQISGSDEGFYPPMSDYIKTLPFTLYEGYRKENVPNEVDLIVIGKTGRLKKDTNEEVRAAYESGVEIKSFPEVLQNLIQDKHALVVVGSFGKSTVTSIIAWCLLHAKKDPSYFIGALPIGMDETSGLGASDIFVLEGDEYPTSNTDSASKFMYYNPHDVLLISADHDHYDQFPTHEDFLDRFRQLLETIPLDGMLASCSDNKHVRDLVKNYSKKITTYGLDEKHSPEWSANDFDFGETSTFTLTKDGSSVSKIKTQLLGKHNVQNIVGAAAILLEKELVTREEFADAIKEFKGITRRLDRKTNDSSVLVYEGFGSSYEKTRAAIDAIKLHFPNKKLLTVFEPHTFSWRNPDSLSWYSKAFIGSAHLTLYHEEEHRGSVSKELTPDQMIAEIEKADIPVRLVENPENALTGLKKHLTEDSVVLILSSGGMSGLIPRIVSLVEDRFPKP